MSERIQLSAPKIRVVFGDINNESSWRELTVQTVQRDRLQVEQKLAAQKRSISNWGLLATTMMAYFALRRRELIPDITYDDFEAGCIDVEPLEDEPVDPTQPEPSPE